MFTAIGYGSVRHGYLWLQSHDVRTGFDVVPTLYLELLGLILLFVGAIPWKPIQRPLSRFPRDSKETRTRNNHHRHDGRI
jgi:hypothetical protein